MDEQQFQGDEYQVSPAGMRLNDAPIFAPEGPVEFTHTPVIVVLLLSIFTYGLYIPWWFISRKDQLNAASPNEQLQNGPFHGVMLIYAISLIMLVVSLVIPLDVATEKGLESLDRFINLVGGIVILVQSFKVRRMLQGATGASLSGPGTFFFQHMYLQYKMNQLGTPQQ